MARGKPGKFDQVGGGKKTHIDRKPGHSGREHPPLQDQDAAARLPEQVRGGQPGRAVADHHDLFLSRHHTAPLRKFTGSAGVSPAPASARHKSFHSLRAPPRGIKGSLENSESGGKPPQSKARASPRTPHEFSSSPCDAHRVIIRLSTKYHGLSGLE